jgi:acetyl esterase
LAPEHPFPAASDDAEAALRWVLAHAAALGGDASHIAVAGDSAGAQLALVAARRVKAAKVRALGLIYPVAQHPDEPSASYAENDGKFLTTGVAVAHQHYPSAIHACIHFTAVSPVGLKVMTDLSQWLRENV